MKKIFKNVLGISTAMMLCTSLAGLGGSAAMAKSKASKAAMQNKVNLVLATNWGEGDSKYKYFNAKLKEFEKKYADSIDVSLETYSTEDYKTKIKTQTASGDLPDVFTYWGGAMMNDMVNAGLLLNVDDYFKASSTVKRKDFEPSSFGYYTAADGKAYGIPIESTRGIFLANTEIFKKYHLHIPKTYNDLKNVSKVLNKNGIIPIAMASNGGTPSEFFYSEIYNQYKGAADELKNLANSKKFNTANALKTAKDIQDMIKNNMFPKDTVANGGWGPCLQLYTDQKAAMTYTYPWMFEFIPDNIQKISDIVPIPMMPDANINPSTIMTGFTVYGFEINKASFNDTAKHNAMIKLCDFMASNDLSTNLTKSGMIPAKEINVDMKGQKLIYQKMMTYAKGKKLIQVHYTTIPSQAALNMLDSSLDELFIKSLTPQSFVNKVQAVLSKK